jgi:uncharacterized protein YjdB
MRRHSDALIAPPIRCGAAVAVAIALAVVACPAPGADTDPNRPPGCPEDGTLPIAVAPNPAAVVVGATVDVDAVFTTGCQFGPTRWESANANIVRVELPASSPTGGPGYAPSARLRGVSPGTTVVEALHARLVSGQGPRGTVNVTAIPVAAVAVTATPTTLTVGGLATATARLTAAAGQVLTDPWYGVTWLSSDTTRATVAASASDPHIAIVTARATGTVTITATSTVSSVASTAGSVTVTVSATTPVTVSRVVVTGPATISLQQVVRFSAAAFDAAGNPITNRAVSWTSSDSSKAAVARDPVTQEGVVRGVALGTASITATIDGIRGSAATNVVGPTAPITSIIVAPASLSVEVGGSRSLVATLRDASQLSQPGTVTWSSSDSARATVTADIDSRNATVRGIAEGGPVTIRATHSEGPSTLSATASVTVTPSTTPRFAYALADQPTATSYTTAAATSFSSTGGAITVARTGTGAYTVTFAGQSSGAGRTETVLVTAYGAIEANCHLASLWSNAAPNLVAQVVCFTTFGLPLDAAFSIQLLGSDAISTGRLAMTVADQETAATYSATTRTFSSALQPISVRRISAGFYTVHFQGEARTLAPETVMLTTIGASGTRCAFDGTGLLVGDSVQVRCVEAASGNGGPTDSKFAVVLLEQGRPGQRAAFATTAQTGVAILGSQSFSSAGTSPTITQTGTGRYDVTFPGLAATGTAGKESVQLSLRTTVGSTCSLVSWRYAGTNLVVTAQCYHEDGLGPEDHDFKILILQ